MSPKERAERASAGLAHGTRHSPNLSQEDMAAEFVRNLLHFCEQRGIKFERVVSSAMHSFTQDVVSMVKLKGPSDE